MTDQPVALVTGSRGGIGLEVVAALLRDGFRVAGLAHTTDPGGNAELELITDVADRAQCDAAVAKVVERFGRLDVVANCAGVNGWAPFAEFDVDDAKKLFDINVWGTINLLSAARPHLEASPCASVVMITSTAGELGIAGTTGYGMTKASLGSLVRTLAVEWAAIPVRVNTVSATIVRTAMNEEARKSAEYLEQKLQTIPIGRIIEPEEVAETVAFLAGPRSSGITGEVIHVDGGVMIKG